MKADVKHWQASNPLISVVMNKVILLNSRPIGKTTLGDLKTIKEEMPTAKDGELLLKTLYVSVDPYLRGR
jgi:hypothetical protein